MKEITILNSRRFNIAKDSPESHRSALNMGLINLGVSIKNAFPGDKIDTKTVACWGWKNGQALKEAGHNVLVLERGYIGDRFKYTSLGFNGLNNYAEFPQYEDDGGERFRKHGGVIKPWKDGGSYILVLGQVRGDASLQGRNIQEWYVDVCTKVQDFYKIPVYFRMHPDAKRRGGYYQVNGNVANLGGTLQGALEASLFTVAFNSNSCLDSILNGVPSYAGDKGTMAYNLCMKDLQKIVYPDREKIAHSIAWTQWNREEIESGFALRKIVERI